MDILGAFRIPVSALKAGEAAYSWTLGPDFFTAIDEDHPAPDGGFHATMALQRTAALVTMEFAIEGHLLTLCDRCTAPITIPVTGEYQVILKPGNPDDSTDEVIYYEPEATYISVAQLVYDFAILSIPITRRLDGCESLDPAPCDATVLSYLRKSEEEALQLRKESGNPWDDLKKVFDN